MTTQELLKRIQECTHAKAAFIAERRRLLLEFLLEDPERLKNIRGKRKQRAVARAAGVPQYYASNLERGSIDLKEEAVIALLRIYAEMENGSV